MAHEFDLRMETTYGEDNKAETLKVENLVDGEWQPLGLNESSPGFLVFVYSILTCQHLFLCLNGTERNLTFRSSNALMHMQTDDEWNVDVMRLHFDVDLAKGEPTQEDIDHIISRMAACPVSRNLPSSFNVVTTVDFTVSD